MMSTQPMFYRFLGIHSLLIGLFPFFIPVFLWNAGFNLAHISMFLAASGAAFCLSIRLWEWTEHRVSLPALMSITLVLELALLAINLSPAAGAASGVGYLLIFGCVNGIYNCFFWTTQRTLFLNIITTRNSGRQYGNFQIFVMVFLKGGIFAGGILLEHFGFTWVFAVSTLIVALSISFLWVTRSKFPPSRIAHRDGETAVSLLSKKKYQPVLLNQIMTFKDRNRSRTIFVTDGLFLFLESHFWTISLFLIMEENFARLGIIVIVLAVIFGTLFYLAKNSIDHLMGKRLFQVAVILYAASWFIRSFATSDLNTQSLFVLLLLITFFSSFFRLAFNKRFYDVAQSSHELIDGASHKESNAARNYLVIKSYYTQFAAAWLFGLIAAIAWYLNEDTNTLKYIYLCASVCALGYLTYRDELSARNSS